MDREKVIKGLEHCKKYGSLGGNDCNGHYEYTDNLQEIIKANNHRKDCPYGKCKTGCVVTLVGDALAVLKEQEKLINELIELGYPHNFQHEAPWVIDYLYSLTEIIKKAFKAKESR